MICIPSNGGDLSGSAVDRNLRLITVEGGAHSLMVGLGETYLAALVIAVGLGETLAGLVTTVPVLVGACLQLSSFWGVRLLNSNKNWAALSAGVQATSAALIALLVLTNHASAWLLFSVAGLYWFGGLAAGPAWNAWIQHAVPEQCRANYLGSRARICQCCILAGLLTAGAFLRTFTGAQVFVLLFGVAALCRSVSAAALAVSSELPEWRPQRSDASTSFLENIRSMDFASVKLLTFLFCMQSAVYVSAPFFTPYMLSHLELDYLEYTWLIGLGFAGKILAMPWAGRLATRYGTNRILWIGSLGIIPMAIVWTVTTSLTMLSVAQVVSGILWAFYELATMLLFFERIAPAQRVAALSVYNLGNAVSMVVGSLVGSALLSAFAGDVFGYYVVFAASSFGRMMSCFLVPARPFVAGPPKSIPLLRLIALRPILGTWSRPIFTRSPASITPTPITSAPVAVLVTASATEPTTDSATVPAVVSAAVAVVPPPEAGEVHLVHRKPCIFPPADWSSPNQCEHSLS